MEADPDGNTVIFQLLLLLLFTLMNAFFAGAEMAVVSVNRNRIRSLAEDGNKKARVIQGLFEDSTRFLSAIQVAITFAGFYSSASAASGIAPVLAGWMKELQIPYSSAIAHNGVTLLLMFFNLVFGELVPKRIALQKSGSFLYADCHAGSLYLDHTLTVYQASVGIHKRCAAASADENGR